VRADLEGLAARYRDFAAAAAGQSPCFEQWATSVANDPEVLRWLAALPRHKQQPNLVFAAARWHGVPAPGPYEGLRLALTRDDGSVRRPTRPPTSSRSAVEASPGRISTEPP